MSGGSQLKLSQFLVGTPVGDAIIDAYRRGVVVAGTSAGASVMSRFMISLGDEGLTPRQRSSQLTAGLGCWRTSSSTSTSTSAAATAG
jgi:cyanophycinase